MWLINKLSNTVVTATLSSKNTSLLVYVRIYVLAVNLYSSSLHALLELCSSLSRLFLFTNMASVGADSSAESKLIVLPSVWNAILTRANCSCLPAMINLSQLQACVLIA